MRDYRNYSLLQHNTFGIDARCDRFLEFESAEELQKIVLSLTKDDCPLLIIGGGSNLLLTGDFHGTVIHSSIKGTTCLPSDDPSVILLRCGSGETWDDIVELCVTNGWYGAENLSLIPGEVGASAVQNIGAYGVEAKDIIADIRAWDRVEGRFVDIDPATCAYGYRTSKFKTEWKGRFIITAVTYRLSRDPQPRLDYGGLRKALADRGVETLSPTSGHPRPDKREGPAGEASGRGREATVGDSVSATLTPQIIRQTIIDIRNAKLPDPAVTGSAGSFFCNPVISREHFERIKDIARQDNGPDYQVPHYEVGDQIKVPAVWMIEQCGFKGKRLGGAQVYQNQPLVIVNASGEASPEEIIGLETEVIQAIETKYGITLHPEVEHI